MFNINKNKSGFTLIEVLVSITITILLFFILTEAYILSQKIYSKTDAKAEITQNGRVILDRLIRELRQTTDIISDIPETIATASNEIIFQDGHNANKINYIRYYLQDKNLMRQEIYLFFPEDPEIYVYFYATDKFGNPAQLGSTTPKIIGEFVDDIDFWGNGLININLNLSKNNQSEIINTAVYGRNL